MAPPSTPAISTAAAICRQRMPASGPAARRESVRAADAFGRAGGADLVIQLGAQISEPAVELALRIELAAEFGIGEQRLARAGRAVRRPFRKVRPVGAEAGGKLGEALVTHGRLLRRKARSASAAARGRAAIRRRAR